ncbi:MAG: M23 family metallopeptidase [bacterium]|nr:M23 family metallopeptidase [bacterium]
MLRLVFAMLALAAASCGSGQGIHGCTAGARQQAVRVRERITQIAWGNVHRRTTSRERVDPLRASATPPPALRQLSWPIETRGEISSVFGDSRPGRRHQGVDIAIRSGTPVLAAADGVVVASGWNGGYGSTILVAHRNGYRTRYAHLSTRFVRIGDRVARGAAIGTIGSTGTSSGPHLHYEVLRHGRPVNPLLFYHLREPAPTLLARR